MILREMTEQVNAIFRECEVLLSKHAVMEGQDLDHFDWELDEDFITIQTQDKISLILADLIPKLASNSLNMEEIPELLRVTGVDALAEYFRNNDEDCFFLWEFFSGLSEYDNPWEPLNQAIRNYFSLEKISQISSLTEFNLAAAGYCDAPWLYAGFTTLEKMNQSLEIVKALKKSIYCGPENESKVSEAAEIISNKIASNPKPLEFAGSTAGYETSVIDFAEKLNDSLVGDELFGDDLLTAMFDQDEDVNLQLLNDHYLRWEPYLQSHKQDFFWAASGLFKLPMGDPDNSFNPESDIHIIETLHERRIIEDEDETYEQYISQAEWRIVLVRTGMKDEYDSDSDKALLERQIRRASEIHECEFEEFRGIRRWVRYFEDEEIFGPPS